jgi:hypothetical protein
LEQLFGPTGLYGGPEAAGMQPAAQTGRPGLMGH